MSKPTRLLVLGLGNVLLGDDGVGAAAIASLLDQYAVPRGVRVLDGGTLGLALLPYLDEADDVILVDAIRSDGPPGTLVRLDGDQVAPAVATRLSPHQIGVSDLLDGARWLDRYPSRLVLLGLVPEADRAERGAVARRRSLIARAGGAGRRGSGQSGVLLCPRRTHEDR